MDPGEGGALVARGGTKAEGSGEDGEVAAVADRGYL